MDLMFFQLSEYPLKVRRNFLFIAVLIYLHTKVETLSNLRIFSISIPESIVEQGLLIGMVWFSSNYFYYLYAEYVEWKSKHILRGVTDKRGLKEKTLVPEINQLADNTFEVSLKFSSQISNNLFERNDASEIEKTWGRQSEQLAVRVSQQIQNDLVKIGNFQNTIWRYKTANRIRFWVLDIAAPVLALILSIYFLFPAIASDLIT